MPQGYKNGIKLIPPSHKGQKKSQETVERMKIGQQKRQQEKPTPFGKKSPNYIDGRTSNREYRSWIKNKRNRIKRQLNKDGSFHTFGEWETLKAQYGYTCPCCHKIEPEIKLTEDHIIPLSKGGSDLIENIQPLCLDCNRRKNAKVIKYGILVASTPAT